MPPELLLPLALFELLPEPGSRAMNVIPFALAYVLAALFWYPYISPGFQLPCEPMLTTDLGIVIEETAEFVKAPDSIASTEFGMLTELTFLLYEKDPAPIVLVFAEKDTDDLPGGTRMSLDPEALYRHPSYDE